MDEGQKKSKMPEILEGAEIADVVEIAENSESDTDKCQKKSENTVRTQSADSAEDSDVIDSAISPLDAAYERALDRMRGSPFTKEYCLLGNISDFGEEALLRPGKKTSIMVVYDQVFGISFPRDCHAAAVAQLTTTLTNQISNTMENYYFNSYVDVDSKVRNSRNCGAWFVKQSDFAVSIGATSENSRFLLATEVGVHNEDMNMLLLEAEVLLNYYTTTLYVLLVNVECIRAGVPQTIRYMLCRRLPNNRLLKYEQYVEKHQIKCEFEKKLGPRRVSEKELLVITREEIADNYDLEVVADETVTRDNIRDVVFHLDYDYINQYIPLPSEFVGNLTITIPSVISRRIMNATDE